MVIVKLENVGLRYGVGPEVLRDVSLTLEEGAFHFLTGPSGAEIIPAEINVSGASPNPGAYFPVRQ